MSCLRDTKNPVVVVIAGIDTTLKASQELVATGIVQVATNAEIAAGFPAPVPATQTKHAIY